jgi:hypothetical protein
VETLDGRVRQAGHDAGPSAMSVSLASDGGAPRTEPVTWEYAGGVAVDLDADGFVASRPTSLLLNFDDPMYTNYHWVAMLDPVEVADGVRRDDGSAAPPVDIDELREVEHGGRPAWEAVVRTTSAYDPRCGCCPLLFGRDSEDVELAAGGPALRDREPDLVYADRHRVRLDLGTGVCVLTEEIGGTYSGTGHDVRIEAVDEALPDALFDMPSQPRWWHRFRNDHAG